MSKIKTFQAPIIASKSGGCYVEVPFDVVAQFGQKRLKVLATFDDVEYRGLCVKHGTPCHILIIKKDIRAQIGKQAGDMVTVTMQADLAKRTVIVPDDLQEAMNAKPGVTAFFSALAYTHRKEYVHWINDAKKETTRLRRIKKAVEMLSEGKKGR